MCNCAKCQKWYRNGSIQGVCRNGKSANFNKIVLYNNSCGVGYP